MDQTHSIEMYLTFVKKQVHYLTKDIEICNTKRELLNSKIVKTPSTKLIVDFVETEINELTCVIVKKHEKIISFLEDAKARNESMQHNLNQESMMPQLVTSLPKEGTTETMNFEPPAASTFVSAKESSNPESVMPPPAANNLEFQFAIPLVPVRQVKTKTNNFVPTVTSTFVKANESSNPESVMPPPAANNLEFQFAIPLVSVKQVKMKTINLKPAISEFAILKVPSKQVETKTNNFEPPVTSTFVKASSTKKTRSKLQKYKCSQCSKEIKEVEPYKQHINFCKGPKVPGDIKTNNFEPPVTSTFVKPTNNEFAIPKVPEKQVDTKSNNFEPPTQKVVKAKKQRLNK